VAKSLKEIDYMTLLPEEGTAALKHLELLARSKMLGSINGRHNSPGKGSSVEFAEHRQYAPGDDLRNLDWRVYGKNDRYYIKQYIEETNLRATLVVDASGSMAYTGDAATQVGGRRLSKFDYGQHLAAALAYLLIGQRDAAGLVTFDTQVRDFIRPASKPSQVRQILQTLHATAPGGETAVSEVLHDVAERIPARGLVILISDLFDDPQKIIEALHHFGYRKHELIVFHLMADEELSFPFKNFSDFQDLEIGEQRIKVDPAAIKAEYLERVRAFVAAIEKGCGQLRADYVPVNTRENYTEVLSSYLSRRKGGGR